MTLQSSFLFSVRQAMAARNQQLPVNEQKQQTKRREKAIRKGKPEILQSDMLILSGV